MNSLLSLFTLQISATDFNMDSEVNPVQVIIFLSVLAVIIASLIIINRNSSSAGKTKGKSDGGSSISLLSRFKLHRMARNIGLDNVQIKMLDYVFRIDGVAEPEKSLGNAVLLDRHFRRAYRVIEQSSNTEEEAQRKLSVLFSTRNKLENSAIGTITSSKQLKEDAILIISHGKDKLEVSVLASKNESLIVETPKTVLGSQIKIPVGTRLTIVFFSKSNKCYSFETRIAGYTTSHSQPAMQLAHSNQVRFLSQRRFRRRQSFIACFLFLVYVEGSGKKTRLIVDKRRISGTIADISVGGCSIKAVAPIQVGAKFKIEFMHRDINIAALGQVLRTNRAGMNTTIHIKFLKVSQRSMNSINAFVYEYANE